MNHGRWNKQFFFSDLDHEDYHLLVQTPDKSKWGQSKIKTCRKKEFNFTLTPFILYDAFRKAHKDLVTYSLSNDNNYRQADWSESVAVGSKYYVETIRVKLGFRVKGRKIFENDGGFQLREKMASYIANSDSKNDNIGGQNTFLWDINHEFTSN